MNSSPITGETPSRASYSALIRAKNSESTLPEVIRRLKCQQHPPSEIIIVDSGSSDRTVDIAVEEGCKTIFYPKNEEFNYSKAINIGIQALETEFALVLSSHAGLPAADTTRWMLLLLTRFDLSAVYCPIHGSGPMTESLAPRFHTIDKSNFNGMNGISNVCALYRRHDLLTFPFDESIPTAEDQMWAARCYHRNMSNSATCCLASHRIAYWNRAANASKSTRDLVFIHKHVLPRSSFDFRVAKLLANSGAWLLRGKTKYARRNFVVAGRLLKWRISTMLGKSDQD